MQNESQQSAPTKPVLPSVFAVQSGFRVAVFETGGPRSYLGPPVLLWPNTAAFTREPEIADAVTFDTLLEGCAAADIVLKAFEWPSTGRRIVEVIDGDGAVVSRVVFAKNGLSALSLLSRARDFGPN